MHFTDRDIVLRWREDALRDTGGEPAGALSTADSWLVDDGAVRGYDVHWARFGGRCGALGVAPEALARFRAAVTATLPRAGRWFPRVELGADDRALRLRLRPAPPAAQREARVIVGPPGDPRSQPTVKGPDLELLLGLRARAAAQGADDVLLCDEQGRLVEGALHSLLWWEDETLCTTPMQRTLPGVTRALLLAIAAEQGVAVDVRSPLPEELAGRETWLTNAVVGIRVVSAWGPEPASVEPVHARAWQAALDRTARSLDEG